MASKKYWILPFLIVTSIVLHKMDVLHLGYLYIKSHEMKYTMLSYNWYPSEGDIFTTDEVVTLGYNYEEGVMAIKPDYEDLLQRDLDEIAINRDKIDSIEQQDLSFYSGPYRVNLCLDHKKVKYQDSALFKMHAKVDILGQFEIYDRDNSELLHSESGEKFWIRDSIVIKGWARKELLANKIEEIWLAQASDRVIDFVEEFDESYKYRKGSDGLLAFVALQKVYTGEPIESYDLLKQETQSLLYELRRMYNNGSPTYGYHGDPNYQKLAYGTSDHR